MTPRSSPLNAARPGNLEGGRYRYMSDLLALKATATGADPKLFNPATPLIAQAWALAMQDHPDEQFVEYILGGICFGFHIGASRSIVLCPSKEGNLFLVKQRPSQVADHLRAELEAGRLLRPLPVHLARCCQVSPIGLIPKPHQRVGLELKWRLIVDPVRGKCQ